MKRETVVYQTKPVLKDSTRQALLTVRANVHDLKLDADELADILSDVVRCIRESDGFNGVQVIFGIESTTKDGIPSHVLVVSTSDMQLDKKDK